MPQSNSLFDVNSIVLLYRLISGSVPLVGEHLEVELCQQLVVKKQARIVTLAEKPAAIATLDGVSVFLRHYNALSLVEALEKHRRSHCFILGLSSP